VSSEHDHHDDDGGHEIDKMPYGRLFNLLVGLSALTLLACIGVIQMFNIQARSIAEEHDSLENKENYSSYRDYREESAAIAAGYGVFEFEVSVPGQDELVEETRYYVPLTAAKKAVIDDAKLLDGTPAGRDWESSAVAKQIKDWGGMPKPQPKEPEKRPEVERPERPKPVPTKPAEGGEGDKKEPADEGDKKEPAEGDDKAPDDGETDGADEGDPKAPARGGKKGGRKPPKQPKPPKKPKPAKPTEGKGDAGE
jgi:hypothetical protein